MTHVNVRDVLITSNYKSHIHNSRISNNLIKSERHKNYERYFVTVLINLAESPLKSPIFLSNAIAYAKYMCIEGSGMKLMTLFGRGREWEL
jgi:hypothetical protein